MAYYKREDFDVFVKSKYNKYSDKYLHSLEIYKIFGEEKFERIYLHSWKHVSDNIQDTIKACESFKKNFIVASSCEIDLNYPLTGKNYDTVWLVDFEKNTVRCLNGITGHESYYIDDILKFEGNIFAPCAGTKGSWNRLEVNYPELKEQLDRIIKEYNKGIARKKLYELNAEIIREEINNENS